MVLYPCGLHSRPPPQHINPVWSWKNNYTNPTWGCCCAVLSHIQFFVITMGWCLPGSSIHGILQARILERVAIFYSRASSGPRDWTHISCVSCIGRQVLYHCTPWEASHMRDFLKSPWPESSKLWSLSKTRSLRSGHNQEEILWWKKKSREKLRKSHQKWVSCETNASRLVHELW